MTEYEKSVKKQENSESLYFLASGLFIIKVILIMS